MNGPLARRIDYATTLTKRQKWLILSGVLTGLFLAALDQTIVATALPRMVADLQGMDLLSWVSTAYLLASTAMVPIYGKLSDLYGRKVIVLTGIAVFLAGSMLCGIAPTMTALAAFRGVQGLGAAALTSTAFAIPADLFPPAERARYQGIFGGVFALASVVGPFVGGFLTDSVGWRWVFYVNVPIGAVAFAFIAARMPRLESGLRGKIDFLGAALLLAAVVPFLLALTLDRARYPWSSRTILWLFGVAAAATVAFLVVETRADQPVIPIRLFRNRTFGLIIPTSVLAGAALLGIVMFLSIYLVNVLGVSATAAGTALMPMTLCLALSAFLSSLWVQRSGQWKTSILVGFVILGAGYWWLTRLRTDTTLWEARLRMIVLGLGFGPTLPVLNLALQNAVPFEQVGVATASRQFFQQLGGAVGIAVLSVLFVNTISQSLEHDLAPLREALPPAERAMLDPARLRNGHGGEMGGRASFGRRSRPGAGGAAAPALDPAAAAIRRQIDVASKRAFTLAVTRVYRAGLPIVVLAFVLMLFVPHAPLRRTNRDSVPAPGGAAAGT